MLVAVWVCELTPSPTNTGLPNWFWVVPRSFSATATLYLAHSPGTDDGVDMANDLALLQTNAVAERAASLLGNPHLTAGELLGKEPGTAVSAPVAGLMVYAEMVSAIMFAT